jgi:3-oxoadipate enol-lactonase
MPQAKTPDGVNLYYEEAGDGPPLLFVHEYCGDWRSWEPQMRFFARSYRCITYSFRGYPGSDVPGPASMYGQKHAVDDAKHMLDHLDIPKAHIVGLSQGAFATAHFGRLYRDRALSLTLAGRGSGAGRDGHEQFKKDAQATAARIAREGTATYAEGLATNPTRSRFRQKDPRGFAEFVKHLSEHSDHGAASTMAEYQGKRPSLYDFDAEWKKLDLPTLIVCGDEDEPCLQTSLYLKKVLPNAGLAMFAKTGHAVNIEEPDAFNRELWDFLALAAAGKWTPAEPLGANASLI